MSSPGFQWRTKVEIMGVEIVGVHWGMTDVSIMVRKKTLLNTYTWCASKSDYNVKTSQKSYYCHLLDTNQTPRLLYQQTRRKPFFPLNPVWVSFSPTLFSLFSPFNASLLSKRNCSCLSISGTRDCIIRTCHFLSGRVKVAEPSACHVQEKIIRI